MIRYGAATSFLHRTDPSITESPLECVRTLGGFFIIGANMGKPFFFRVTAGDLIDFATDEESDGITLLKFAKELQKGRSDVPYIQSLIDEAHNYIEKKRLSGSKGGKAKASTAIAPLENALALPSTAVANPSTPLASSSSSTEVIKPSPKKDMHMEGFELFWEAFGYKKGRGGAEKSWQDIKNYSPELLSKILSSAKKEAMNRPALIAKNCTPKMAQGWLTDRRWEDEGIVNQCVTPSWH